MDERVYGTERRRRSTDRRKGEKPEICGRGLECATLRWRVDITSPAMVGRHDAPVRALLSKYARTLSLQLNLLASMIDGGARTKDS